MSHPQIKVLIIGATGQVGQSLVQLGRRDDDFELITPNQKTLDINNQQLITAALTQYQPDYVINAAAYTDVEKAESDADACYALNCDAVGFLGQACEQAKVPLLHLSTDYVFDGTQSLPYKEEDEPAPLSVYGMSKLKGEERLKKTTERYILLRVCGVFSPWRKNFVKTIFNAFKQQKELRVINDQYCCPTGSHDIARVLLAIIKQLHCGANAWGTYHYVAADVTTWHAFAENIVYEAAKQLKSKAIVVSPISTSDYPTKAKRPTNSVLDCQKILNTFGVQQRSWQDDLIEVVRVLSEAP
jgi:dTDP-4-dehydrorhamnose reductase